MDPTESELEAALEALTDEMLVMGPGLETWYRTIIQWAHRGDKGAVKAVMSWWRQHQIAKLNPAKASERTLDMSRVLATVANIDQNSVCEEEDCKQRGELYKDHRVTHQAKGTKKGLRGECPHCGGRLHNTNDAAQLIAFQCLWRQRWGDQARRTPVNAMTLERVVDSITSGKISKWADQSALLTILAGPPLPKPGGTAVAPSTPGTSPTGAAAATAPPPVSTPTAAPAAPGAGTTSPGTSAPAPVPVVDDEAAKAEKKRKLREALKGARPMP